MVLGRKVKAVNPEPILVVGDTHGNLSWMLDEVIPYASERGVEKIVQVGDFGFIWPGSGNRLRRLSDALRASGIDLHFLPGNHEDHVQLSRMCSPTVVTAEGHYVLYPGVYYTGRVASWMWHTRRFAAVGGATSIDRQFRTPYVSWWPEEILTADEVGQAKSLGKVDVLFSHDAPTAYPLPLIPDVDSLANRQRMDDVGRCLRPELWFHGHYHCRVEYWFRHSAGECPVVALDRDGSPHAKGMVLLPLVDAR